MPSTTTTTTTTTAEGTTTTTTTTTTVTTTAAACPALPEPEPEPTIPEQAAGVGCRKRLFVLAFDHRSSYSNKLFEVPKDRAPTADELSAIAESKLLIYHGFLHAVSSDPGLAGAAGFLVDEQFGAAAHAEARESGANVLRGVPAESSGGDFAFEYGDEFGVHIDALEPSFVKVKVDYNPEGDSDVNARALATLKRLSDFLLERPEIDFLLEPLVPPTPAQLEAAGGDKEEYVRTARPGLTVRAIAEMQAAGLAVSRYDITAIWVAFFSRCQRYRC